MTRRAGKLCTCNPVSGSFFVLYPRIFILPLVFASAEWAAHVQVSIDDFIGLLNESRTTISVVSPVGTAFLVCQQRIMIRGIRGALASLVSSSNQIGATDNGPEPGSDQVRANRPR
jgi:hypothetical protein